MKITALEAIPYALPYRRPAGFATGEITRGEHVLVRVHTDEGVTGQAEATARPYTYGESQHSIVAAVRDWFAPSLVGLDPLAHERAYEAMAWVVHNHTARAAVDLAIWDIMGITLGRPCHILLGGYADDVAVSHMVSYAEPRAMAEDALAMREEHRVGTFKVKVGRDVELDIAACRAVRDAVGPDASLYVDANHGWSAQDAARAVRAMAELGITALEEPCPADDVLARRQLASSVDIPVVGDESCTRLADVAREVLDGRAQMVSIKTGRTGFTESGRIARLCAALGVPVVLGSQYDGMPGTLASVSFGASSRHTSRLPGELTNFRDLAADILSEPVEITGGRLAPRTRPGLGIEIDEDKLGHYRCDR